METWVTSVADDGEGQYALLLGGSLRRVKTGKKLVVLVSTRISPDLLHQLEAVYDGVSLIRGEAPGSDKAELTYLAKIQALTMNLSQKCVYLSCKSLVAWNSDDLFGKYDSLAMAKGEEPDSLDSSIFFASPPSIRKTGLTPPQWTTIAPKNGNLFEKWMAESMKDIKVELLDPAYLTRISINAEREQSGATWNTSGGGLRIMTFTAEHPLDIETWELKNFQGIEKIAVNLCHEIRHGLESILADKISIRLLPSTPEPIAIVGMSFRLPGANTADEFWTMLINGHEGVGPLPSHRWSKEHTIRPHASAEMEAGFLQSRIDEFDSKFFGVGRNDAVYLDPQTRLMMECSWEALEEAGINPTTLFGTPTGVFAATWIHNYRDICLTMPDMNFLRTLLGNSISASAARLSHFFGTTGLSVGVESACSSSVIAVDLARKNLLNGESSMALVCGANLFATPFAYDDLEMILSRDGRCKTFDERADGFSRAEGAACLVLKRQSDAIRDGDNIWGLIRGSAVTQEGISKSLGTPTVDCESLAMELALKDAGVNPKDVSLVETHGTGTPVGDPIEVIAIQKAYSTGERADPLFLTSVKTNIGHTESVAGIAGIVKVLLAMKHEIIPPHRNFTSLNPSIQLDSIPAQIPLKPAPWPRLEGKPRLAGVSCFGITGADGHVIIEEPPTRLPLPVTTQQDRPLHIMKVSAKSHQALSELFQAYGNLASEQLDQKEHTFADMAFSANTGRATFVHRGVIIAENFTQAENALRKKTVQTSEVQAGVAPLCFLFTGQGSQYPGMGKVLYETSPTFRHHFDRCDIFLQKHFDISVKAAIWGDSATEDSLARTLYSQTAIFSMEYALLRLWESWGVKPDYVLGHSLGEFCAAVAASALSMEEALTLVAERSNMIDSLPRGKMLVIKADKRRVDEMIATFQRKESMADFWVDFAAINSPDQTVVAGKPQQILAIAEFCGKVGVKAIPLGATHAFHSRSMDPMLGAYRRVASNNLKHKDIYPKELHPKYISGMAGELVDLATLRQPDYWTRHTRNSVRFMEACKVVEKEGASIFVEIGPHPVLAAFAATNIGGVTCLPSLRKNAEDWSTLLDSVSKLFLSPWKGEIDWKGFDSGYQRHRMALPFYPFQRKSVWHHSPREQPHLHPLLGKLIPTSESIGGTLFHTQLTLKTIPYVADHLIGSTIIYPGACFMEMCLAAGHVSTQGVVDSVGKPRRPVSLKDVKISTPLALKAEEFALLQTVVSTSSTEQCPDGSYAVTVHSRSDPREPGTGNWVSHVTAKYVPVVPRGHPPSFPDIPFTSIKGSWEVVEMESVYNDYAAAGLNFGPKFRSITCGWRDGSQALYSVHLHDEWRSDRSPYFLHPLAGDAMLQAMCLEVFGRKQVLAVPIRIGELILLPTTPDSYSKELYTFCWKEGAYGSEKDKLHCFLADGQGHGVAYMSDVDFLETKVQLIETKLAQQTNAMPMVWEEIWKSSRGPCQKSLDLSEKPLAFNLSAEDLEKCEDLNNISEAEQAFLQKVDKHIALFVARALFELGWAPELEREFAPGDLIVSLGILGKYTELLCYFLKQFVEHNMLSKREELFYLAPSNILPSSTEIEEILKKEQVPPMTSQVEYQKMAEVGIHLPSVLCGKVDPLGVIFSEDPKSVHVADYYAALRKAMRPCLDYHYANIVIPTLERRIGDSSNKGRENQPRLRVLEVGAGTGVFTEDVLRYLRTHKIPTEYHFTDVSTAFFGPAEEKLGRHGRDEVELIYKRFNMDEDPLRQDFIPHYFDFVVAAEALHVAKDLRKALRHIGNVMKVGGALLTVETIRPNPRTMVSFGLLDGYWHFEDSSIRSFGPSLSAERWKVVLESQGYACVHTIPIRNGEHGLITVVRKPGDNDPLDDKDLQRMKYSWLIFDSDSGYGEKHLKPMLQQVNRRVHIVRRPSEKNSACTEDEMRSLISFAYRRAANDVESVEGAIYLWGLGTGKNDVNRDQSVVSLPFLTLCQVVVLELQTKLVVVTRGVFGVEGDDVTQPSASTLGGVVRSIANEYPRAPILHVDLSPCAEAGEEKELFLNLWSRDALQFALRDENRLIPKLVPVVGKVKGDLTLPLPKGCDRFQLSLPDTKRIEDLEFIHLERKLRLEDDEVEIQVKAVALNFRDLLVVIRPMAEFEGAQVGYDIGGIVIRTGTKVTKWKEGDRVIVCSQRRQVSIPSHLVLTEADAFSLPPTMSFWEGVTLPTVFSTVYFCLIEIANVQRGETILIHTASGGVGLCAIQVCRHLGVKVIATAGSERKRRYLRGLGIQHVFHSRTPAFGKQILEVTSGQGVDIVLNSITGAGLKEASMECLKKGGRFLEMSMMNIWTKDEVRAFRPDVVYAVVDLHDFVGEAIHRMGRAFEDYLRRGVLQPIAFTRYDALNIRGALSHLKKAEHIGKIVCVMPEILRGGDNRSLNTPLFTDNSTYLVTGGLGGIGFEIVKWILAWGGRHVVIVSRRRIPDQQTVNEITRLQEGGACIRIMSADVGNYDDMAKVLENIRQANLPPLRGVFHCAGVLADGTLENQTWDKFNHTFNPKVKGSWNLHDLTSDILLEYFVLFSSSSAMVGTPGQANHCASCSFEGALAHYRRSQGLPATTVHWANWGEVGVATDVEFSGCRPISTVQGLLALETFLRTQTTRLTVLNVTSLAKLKVWAARACEFFADVGPTTGETCEQQLQGGTLWQEFDSKGSPEEKIGVLTEYIKLSIRTLLKLDANEVIPDDADLQSLGVDSLVLLELKNHLQNMFGPRLTLSSKMLKECTTCHLLSSRLMDSMEVAVKKNYDNDRAKLIAEDSILPKEICSAGLYPALPVNKVRSILLTGVTGNLGPYLLRELSNREHIEHIYCLIRPTDGVSADVRLRARLAEVDLLHEIYMEKVKILDGDVVDKQLGLSSTAYDTLSNDIDCVVHNAVLVDHNAGYRKSPDFPSRPTGRQVNVLGTKHVLQFCVRKKLKQAYFASTLAILLKPEEDGGIPEGWVGPEALDQFPLNSDYLTSKLISEQLMRAAVERGVPCKVFRFPVISGDSRDGRCDYQKNHVLRRWLSFLKLGIIPTGVIPMPALPVDYCAKYSMALFFSEEVPSDVYNLGPTNCSSEELIISVAEKEFGIHIVRVESSEFNAKVTENSHTIPLAPFALTYDEGVAELVVKEFRNIPLTTMYRNTKVGRYFKNYSVDSPELEDIMRRDLHYLRDAGVFAKFGIQTK